MRRRAIGLSLLALGAVLLGAALAVRLFLVPTMVRLPLDQTGSTTVAYDNATWFDQEVPDGAPYWTHTLEGDDDMPAHIKSSLLDSSLTIPVSDGRLALGTWQGIYLCEHRNHGGSRSLVVTAWGEER